MSNPASFPVHPNFEQLRKRAKDLKKSGQFPTLAAAQLAIARAAGFPSWAKLKIAFDQFELERAIETGDTDTLVQLLDRNPQLAVLPFRDGTSPLHFAAGGDHADAIAPLLRAGATRKSKLAGSSHTALSWAVTTWSYRAAAKLVELGEEPDLFAASGMGLIDKVRAFWVDDVLKPSPSRTGSSRYDETGTRLPSPPPSDADQVSDALYIACRCDRLDVARWLLDHRADPNWRGYAGATCLAWAEFADNADLAALLRSHGGSDDLVDQQYRATPRVFPLMVLAGWGFDPTQLAARLDRDPSAIGVRTDAGTLLHAAAEGGHVATVQLLLERGIDPANTNARGLTALDLARAKGHQPVVTILEGRPSTTT